MQKVWIKKKKYQELFKETNENLPFETGGMLLGYKDILNDIVITNLIVAGPNAIHEEGSFIPDGEFQQSELSRIYTNSGRITTYLGDWHSHPYNYSFMSWRDRRTIKKIAKTKSSREPNPIFIIIGTATNEAKCWKYDKRIKRKLEELQIKQY